MANTPDFAAFDRFRDLNIKNLLYYQTQLNSLGRKLHQQEYADYRNTDGDVADERQLFARRLDVLMEAKGSKQLELVTQIRRLLKEYS
jgi:hypothetical protein